MELRRTKYNRDRERQGERAEIELGDSTKGVAGFTPTRRRPLGLFFNIMYRRVRTYNHIKMKRYRYTYSRYIYQLFSCNFTFGFLLTELWLFSFISPCFLLHINQAVYSNNYKLHVCPGGVCLNNAAKTQGSLS